MMAEAILAGKENRTDKALAGHVVEVLNAILKSGETGQFVEITSTCHRPEPMKTI